MFDRCYIGLEAHGMGFDAHHTLVFLGDLDKDRIDFVKVHLQALGKLEVVAERLIINNWGDVTVLRIIPPQVLYTYRKQLRYQGITPNSKFIYNPHITLDFSGNHTIHIPRFITLNNLYLKTESGRWYVPD